MLSVRAVAVSSSLVLCLAACGSVVAPPRLAVQTTTTASPSVPPPALPPEPHPDLRLPVDVHPVAEAINLTIRPDQDRFSGKVDIDVTSDRERQSIWLHARGLHVSSANVTPTGGTPMAATWTDEDEHGLGRLALASTVPAGPVRIHLQFDGAFVNSTKGIFKVKADGSTYAFTQFEPIDARRAFPCFDEPGFKIPFTVTLTVPAGQEALSNTPEVA